MNHDYLENDLARFRKAKERLLYPSGTLDSRSINYTTLHLLFRTLALGYYTLILRFPAPIRFFFFIVKASERATRSTRAILPGFTALFPEEIQAAAEIQIIGRESNRAPFNSHRFRSHCG